MQRYTEFYLVRVKQTGQIVTEMQTTVPFGFSKSSAILLSVHYTEGASGTDEMK